MTDNTSSNSRGDGHTEGPWLSDGDGGYGELNGFRVVQGSQPGFVLAVAIGDVPDLAACAEANARLIAAAPDLLEAAGDALSGWRYIRQQHGELYGVGWDRVEQALAAAIAKAKGTPA